MSAHRDGLVLLIGGTLVTAGAIRLMRDTAGPSLPRLAAGAVGVCGLGAAFLGLILWLSSNGTE